jgi:hypothetical protein
MAESAAPAREPTTNHPDTPAQALDRLRSDLSTAEPPGRREIERQVRAAKLVDAIMGGGR